MFNKQHEESLQKSISAAIYEDRASLFNRDFFHMKTREECEVIANGVMDRLKEISQMRRILHK